MKKLMILAVAGFAACAAFGDAEFDKFVALANTPTNQIKTVEQAKDVLNACCVVTNNAKASAVVCMKLIPSAEAKSILDTYKTTYDTMRVFAQLECDVDYAKSAIEAAIKIFKAASKDDHSLRHKSKQTINSTTAYIYEPGVDPVITKNPNFVTRRFAYVESAWLVQKAEECMAAGFPELAVQLALNYHEYQIMSSDAVVAWVASNKDKLKNFALSASVEDSADCQSYFTIIRYFWYIGDDDKLVNDIFRADMYAGKFCDHVLAQMTLVKNPEFTKKATEAFLSAASGIHSDKTMLIVSKAADKKLGNNTATESIFNKLVSEKSKFDTAFYLNSTDKLIDLLKVVSDKLDAKTISQAVTVLNGVDADYRVEDMKKALRNINKKYTAKLYDDRDNWEPILSKVRAMLEVL